MPFSFFAKHLRTLPLNPQAFKIVRTLLCKAACGSRIIFRTLLRKAVCDRRIMVKAFCYAKRSRPVFFGVHTLRFTGQSILLCKTVYCQNFATQNRLFRTLLRKVVYDRRIIVKAFCYAKRSSTAPFSSGCILCGS